MKETLATVLGYAVMGALYGFGLVYGPFGDEADESVLKAVALGTFFATFIALGERASGWWKRRRQRDDT